MVREICHEDLEGLIQSLIPVLTQVDEKKFKKIKLDEIKLSLHEIL
jgi:hypothetical protein